MPDNPKNKRQKFHLVHLLLVVPYVVMLWVPFYNAREPSLAGIPFFYWFQMLWIPLGAALLYPAFRAETRDGE